MENSKKVMGFAGHLYDEQLYVIKLDLYNFHVICQTNGKKPAENVGA